MIHILFSIFDSKAAAYLPPFFMHRNEMAQRTFSDCINASDHQFSKHPEDYTLFATAVFDDSTGTVQSYETSEMLGNGLVYISENSPNNETIYEQINEVQTSDISNGASMNKDVPNEEQHDPPIQPSSSG